MKKFVFIFLIAPICSNAMRAPVVFRPNQKSLALRPCEILLEKGQLHRYKQMQGKDLKDPIMKNWMNATVKKSIVGISELYDGQDGLGKSYSYTVLAAARAKLAQEIKEHGSLKAITLVQEAFDKQFMNAIPMPIKKGEFPEIETAITTAAVLYAVFRHYDRATEDAMIRLPNADACESLTNYIWNEKIKGNTRALAKLKWLFVEKV